VVGKWGTHARAAAVGALVWAARVRTRIRRDRAMYSIVPRYYNVDEGRRWRGWRGVGRRFRRGFRACAPRPDVQSARSGHVQHCTMMGMRAWGASVAWMASARSSASVGGSACSALGQTRILSDRTMYSTVPRDGYAWRGRRWQECQCAELSVGRRLCVLRTRPNAYSAQSSHVQHCTVSHTPTERRRRPGGGAAAAAAPVLRWAGSQRVARRAGHEEGMLLMLWEVVGNTVLQPRLLRVRVQY
jgi:hypothetical protein